MKIHFKTANSLLALTLLSTAPARAAVTFTNLYSFQVFPYGENPQAMLVQGSDGALYGTTGTGGTNGGFGAIFKITTNGAATNLYSFTGGSDGANPHAGLVQARDGFLYGTTENGGTNNKGAIFKISTHGVFTRLYSFTGSNDGAYPEASLVQGPDNLLYGGTDNGGTNGIGALFKISTNGAFTKLYSFTGGADGGGVSGGLVFGRDGLLYGATYYGGAKISYNGGTIFKATTNGALTTLYSFGDDVNGGVPTGLLVQGADGLFYGATAFGGTNNDGTVFKITTNGALTSLYSFTGASDGANPGVGLTLGSDGRFYGATGNGATLDSGAIFRITTNGALTTLYDFTGGSDGVDPFTTPILGHDGRFYGTTYYGGTNNIGGIFGVTTNGVFTNLFSFLGGTDGAYPNGLTPAGGGVFYSTATQGGAYGPGLGGGGTVFRITTNGAFTSLYSFSGYDDGAYPESPLVSGGDGYLYGTTYGGGVYGFGDNSYGTIFRVDTNGNLTSLYSFTGGMDGASPNGLLLGNDGDFYGTTAYGGPLGTGYNGYGTIFKKSAIGELIRLYAFTNGIDGANPEASLVSGGDGFFYGTAFGGGSNSLGSVFKIDSSGNFTSLHSFSGTNDGANPEASLVAGGDGFFYGTTYNGGASNNGVIFKISAAGAFTRLYSFTGGVDGANPEAPLVPGGDGFLYGTTINGGTNNSGTVFKFDPAGTLTNLYTFTGGGDGGFPFAPLTCTGIGTFYGTTGGGAAGGVGGVFRLTLHLPTFLDPVVTNGTLKLTWTTDINGKYQLQYKSDPASGAWTNFGGNVTASGATVSETDSLPVTPRRVYRVMQTQ